MLKEFRSIDVYWDKATRRIYEEIRTSSSDEKGRKLTVQVVNDGQTQNLSGTSLSLFWKLGEEEGLDVFTPIDIDNGIFELYFTARMLSNIGKLTAYLYLIDTTGATTSEPFSITVFEGIDAEAVTSEAELTTLTQALVQVQDLKQTWNDKWQNLQDQINADKLNKSLIRIIHQFNKYPVVNCLYWEYGLGTVPLENQPADISWDGTAPTTIPFRVEYPSRQSIEVFVKAADLIPSPTVMNIDDGKRLISGHRIIEVRYK